MKKKIISLVVFITLALSVFTSAVNAFPHTGGMYSEGQINHVKQEVSNQVQPRTSARSELLWLANNRMSRTPSAVVDLHVPGFYEDAQAHSDGARTLQQDADAAYTTALAFKLTGNTAYADKAISESLSRKWTHNKMNFMKLC